MKPEITSLNEYEDAYKRSGEDFKAFWTEIALKHDWIFRPKNVFTGGFSDGNNLWFEGGQMNLCYNCIDRHLPKLQHKAAIIWEANDPNTPSRTISYGELFSLVQHFANVLASLGIHQGDRVAIYMPMIPEAAIAMLACSRVGATHSVIFAGFSAQAVADRIIDAQCEVVLTADSFFRGDKEIHLKKVIDEALTQCPGVKHVVVYQHTHCEVNMVANRDGFWNDLIHENLRFYFPAQMHAHEPGFILYTSGSTGKPKGVVHSVGGYMVQTAYTLRNVFQTQENDVFWCTADIGWITGHSYLLYGPLLNGLTTLMYEGIPTFPDAGRFWDIIDKHQVNILYTAPTVVRSLMAYGDEPLNGKKLSSLRVLGLVGEPTNQEAWDWFDTHVGKNKLPVVDTWWQTETGVILISNLAGITPQKPTFATLPLPGIFPVIVDDNGKEIPNEGEGTLLIKYSWPALAPTTWQSHERYVNTYFAPYPGYYFTGDGAKRDAEGNYRITGRTDDIINVSGHRIGTAELENTLNHHPDVIESAVVGYPHNVKGQGIYAYVVLQNAKNNADTLSPQLIQLVSETIGAFAKPDQIQVAAALPKTRSGKIMRRILRKIASGETTELGDTSTLLDSTVIDSLIKGKK